MDARVNRAFTPVFDGVMPAHDESAIFSVKSFAFVTQVLVTLGLVAGRSVWREKNS
jgi:hypothetical protein